MLRAALVDRAPSMSFGADQVKKVNAGMFYGNAVNRIEVALYTLAGDVGEAADGGAWSRLRDFVDMVRTMQYDSGIDVHARIAKALASRGDRVSSAARLSGGVEVKLAGKRVESPGPEESESTRALYDLVVVLLLRFGAFAGSGQTGRDDTLVGSELIIAYAFKGIHAVNATNRLYNSIGEYMASPIGDVAQADRSLQEMRRLEGVIRSASVKQDAARAETREVLLEALSIAVLAITLIVTTWYLGSTVVGNHRGIALAGSVIVFLYVAARMAYVHLARNNSGV